jgi:hypothetical protein
MARVKIDLDFLKEYGEVKVSKIFTYVTKGEKKAYVSGKNVCLQEYKPEYGEGFQVFDEETIKRRHFGKIKCVKKCKTADEMKNVLTKYFV